MQYVRCTLAATEKQGVYDRPLQSRVGSSYFPLLFNSDFIRFSNSLNFMFSELEIIEIGEPYILLFAFIARFEIPCFALSIYLFGLSVLINNIFEYAISTLSIPVMSSHSINPTLVAFVLSVIPFSSIVNPIFVSNSFRTINTPQIPKKITEITPIILTNPGEFDLADNHPSGFIAN